MRKIIILLCALCLLSSCGSSNKDNNSSNIDSATESEIVYEDIAVYDFIIPAEAKCELTNRSVSSTSIEIHTKNDAVIHAQFFQEETSDGFWFENDMKNRAKVMILLNNNLETDYDDALNAPCEIESESINGFTLYTIADYKNECGVYVCRQYNQSNYGISFSIPLEVPIPGSEKKHSLKITDYHDDISDFLKAIQIT